MCYAGACVTICRNRMLPARNGFLEDTYAYYAL